MSPVTHQLGMQLIRLERRGEDVSGNVEAREMTSLFDLENTIWRVERIHKSVPERLLWTVGCPTIFKACKIADGVTKIFATNNSIVQPVTPADITKPSPRQVFRQQHVGKAKSR